MSSIVLRDVDVPVTRIVIEDLVVGISKEGNDVLIKVVSTVTQRIELTFGLPSDHCIKAISIEETLASSVLFDFPG
jgi:hypothetical protein